MQPLNYLMTTTGMIWLIACLPLGFLLVATGYFVFNKAPAKWFCDYNEQPGAELLTQRVKYKGSGIVLSLLFAVCLMLCRLQFNKGYDIYFCIFALFILVAFLVIVSDYKYTIIPDQFTAFLAVTALAVSVYDLVRGYNILHAAWWSPLLGAVIGVATMLLIDFLGMVIYKKTGMGFGDVKLFAAVGILTGFPGTLYTLTLSILTAAVCFIVILAISAVIKSRSKDKQEVETVAKEQPTDETAAAKGEGDDTVENKNEENGKGSYLAFGPYIMIAAIIYVVFFDYIYDLVEMYFDLLK